MSLDEFLEYPDENIVVEPLDEDEAISVAISCFKDDHVDGIENDDDDSIEVPVVTASAAASSLETVCMFLLQQEGANEHLWLVNLLERFIKEKQLSLMHQTTLDQFFTSQ